MAPRRSQVTLDVDVGLSGGGDPLLIVSFAAELSILVHACKRHGKDRVAHVFLFFLLKKNTPQGQIGAKSLDRVQLSLTAGTG